MKKNFQNKNTKFSTKQINYLNNPKEFNYVDYKYTEAEFPTFESLYERSNVPYTKNKPFIKHTKYGYGIYFQGKLHNEKGPAIVHLNEEYYYLNGIKFETKHDWIKALRSIKLESLK